MQIDGPHTSSVLAPFLAHQRTWDDLQQQHEFEAIPEVLLDVLDLRAGLPKVGVAPRRERLERKQSNGDRMGNYFQHRVMFVELLSQ